MSWWDSPNTFHFCKTPCTDTRLFHFLCCFAYKYIIKISFASDSTCGMFANDRIVSLTARKRQIVDSSSCSIWTAKLLNSRVRVRVLYKQDLLARQCAIRDIRVQGKNKTNDLLWFTTLFNISGYLCDAAISTFLWIVRHTSVTRNSSSFMTDSVTLYLQRTNQS